MDCYPIIYLLGRWWLQPWRSEQQPQRVVSHHWLTMLIPGWPRNWLVDGWISSGTMVSIRFGDADYIWLLCFENMNSKNSFEAKYHHHHMSGKIAITAKLFVGQNPATQNSPSLHSCTWPILSFPAACAACAAQETSAKASGWIILGCLPRKSKGNLRKIYTKPYETMFFFSHERCPT